MKWVYFCIKSKKTAQFNMNYDYFFSIWVWIKSSKRGRKFWNIGMKVEQQLFTLLLFGKFDLHFLHPLLFRFVVHFVVQWTISITIPPSVRAIFVSRELNPTCSATMRFSGGLCFLRRGRSLTCSDGGGDSFCFCSCSFLTPMSCWSGAFILNINKTITVLA